MSNIIYEIFGWIGFVLLIIAYALLSFKKLEPQSFIYQLLNFFGAIFIIINTLHHNAYPPTILNLIWAMIGLVSLINLFKKSRKENEEDSH